MFAIIRSGGKQFKVTEGARVKVPSLSSKVGEQVIFRDVLLLSDGTKRYSGTPTIKGAAVTGIVVRHGRDDKQVIYKYKRRKNYHVKQGHRQGFTEVEIQSIATPSSGKAKEKVTEAAGESEGERIEGAAAAEERAEPSKE